MAARKGKAKRNTNPGTVEGANIRAGVCRSCAKLSASPQGICPTCGQRLEHSVAAFEAWEEARVHERIREWHGRSILDDAARARLAETLIKKDDESQPEGDLSAAATTTSEIEERANAFFARTSTFADEVKERWSRIVAKVESDAPAVTEKEEEIDERPRRADEATEAGRAVFGTSAVVGAGLDALRELDEHEHEHDDKEVAAKPISAGLQVFWFIGAILVLAGSLMGVREAWRSLEGVLRPLVIAGALFAYHVAFVFLARMLARRSETTGRVLGVISIGLAPIAFVAVAVAAGMSRSVGVGSAALLLVASFGTLLTVGGVFDNRSSKGVGIGLALGLLPCLALEVPLGGQEASLTRLLVPIAALAPLAIGAIRARLSKTAISNSILATLGAATYGAIVVAVYAMSGGPNEASLDAGTFGGPMLAAIAWVGLASLIVWLGASGGAISQRLPRTSVVLRIVMLAILAGAALSGSISVFSAPRAVLLAQGALAFMPAIVTLFATVAFCIEGRQRLLALHFAIAAAHLAVAANAFALTAFARTAMVRDSLLPSMWVGSMALVPAALLLLAPHTKSIGYRISVGIWSALSGTAIVFITLATEAFGRQAADASSPYVMTTLVAGGLAVAAHVGGRTARPSQHYLGALMTTIALAAWVLPTRPEPASFLLSVILVVVAMAYGIVGLLYRHHRRAEDDDLQPFDDVSLLAATGVVLVALIGPDPVWSELTQVGSMPASTAIAPILVAAAVLTLRAMTRDRSRLVTAMAGLAIGASIRLFAIGLITIGPDAADRTLRGGLLRLAPVLANQRTATQAAQGVLIAGLTAALLMLLGSLARKPAPTTEKEQRFGRPLFGVIPLPLGGAGGRVVLDGFGIAAVLYAVIGAGRAMTWINAAVYWSPQRELVVMGLAAIILTALAAFLTRGVGVFQARGNVFTLAAGGIAIGLTAVAYRIGRPLPPDVVGWRLTLVLLGVWLLARLIVAKGPALANWLERPSHGTYYHYVAHAGVFALGALLIVDAFLVGGPTSTRFLALTPPMLMAGGALAMMLLHRSSRAKAFMHASLASLLVFACLVGAQGHVLGPVLEPLDRPGGRWMFPEMIPAVRAAEGTPLIANSGTWTQPSVFLPAGLSEFLVSGRATIGLSIFVAACATLLLLSSRVATARKALTFAFVGRIRSEETLGEEAHAEGIENTLLLWTCVSGALATLWIAWQPSLIPAAIVLLAGVIALLAQNQSKLRFAPLMLAMPLFLHAVAHFTGATFPEWTGPAYAALALLVVFFGSRRSAQTNRDLRILVETQSVGAFYGFLALTYAFAAGGTTQNPGALLRVIDRAQFATDGSFALTFSVAITLVVLAVTASIAAWSWQGAIARVASVFPPLFLGVAAVAAASSIVYTPGATLLGLLTINGPLVAALLSGAALVSQVIASTLEHRQREDAAWGTRVGRDFVLVASAGAMAIFALAFAPEVTPGPEALTRGRVAQTSLLGIVAIGIAILISVHEIAKRGTKRHVYFVELLIVALYAFATRTMNLRPEIDALLGLGYGFSLLGVATLARRTGRTEVASATRHFLAALPILIAILTLRNGPMSNTAAMFAVASSVLYAVVALTEGSRVFGSLAAVAANIALVVFALAQGLTGIEIWLGPLGLLVAAMSQIFAPKLTHSARSAVRITGGALLYLPSGLKLALRLGAAEDATYSVVFGAICLLGVVAGIVLKVRAYLALATLSLTLDVIANLVYAGLRDHRLGFVILSASGLFILGMMILITLRRERARALVGTVRSQLSGWD